MKKKLSIGSWAYIFNQTKPTNDFNQVVHMLADLGYEGVELTTHWETLRWLEDHGCDVVIAQGAEAGGHRGMFLTTDPATQIGTIALVPLVVDAVSIPVIATGGITDARGIATAKLREVEVGDFVGNNIPIRSGLAEHDRVVVMGATLISDGEQVQVIP